MSPTTTTQQDVYEQIVDYANRADPYPLYAELRRTPVARLDDGTFLVTGHREILELVHDPRISSDPGNLVGHSLPGHTPRTPRPRATSMLPTLPTPEHPPRRRAPRCCRPS
jgi:hypothetical protein